MSDRPGPGPGLVTLTPEQAAALPGPPVALPVLPAPVDTPAPNSPGGQVIELTEPRGPAPEGAEPPPSPVAAPPAAFHPGVGGGSTGAGSSQTWYQDRPKCRCAPVTRPVAPTAPMRCPAATVSPSATSMAEQWA